FDGDRFIFPNFPRGLENTQHFWRTRLDQVDRRSGQMSTIFDFWTWHADHREQLQSARALAPIPLWSVCPDGAVAVYRPFADSLRVLGKSEDRKSTRLNSSHVKISYAVFCLKKKKKIQ